jgi:hypothetical protein
MTAGVPPGTYCAAFDPGPEAESSCPDGFVCPAGAADDPWERYIR